MSIPTMYKHYLASSIRYLFKKYRLFTYINIFGLSIGFFVLMVSMMFVMDEYSYDRFHNRYNDIYRVVVNWTGDGVSRNWARSSPPIALYAQEMIPEIEKAVRIRKNPGTDLLEYGDAKFYEENLVFADSTFFEIFSYKLIAGNVATVLKDKYSVVISEKTVQKYFPNEDPIGKVLKYDRRFDLTVSGVIKNTPANTHLRFDCIIPFTLLEEIFSEQRLSHWGQFDHYTYIRLKEGTDPEIVRQVFPDFLATRAPEWVSEKMNLDLQPISSIHLSSARHSELTPNSNIAYSYIAISAAVLILIIAVINYINLTTASYISRTKEIGIRRILGSTKSDLIVYLLLESAVISILAQFLALIFVYIFLPDLNQFTGKQLVFWNYYPLFLLNLIFVVLTGLIAGIFPALFFTRWNATAIDNISGNFRLNRKGSQILISFQFIISTFLLIGSGAVSKQLSFLFSNNTGFKGDQVIVVPLKDRSQNNNYQNIIHQITRIEGVEYASFSSTTPGANNGLTYTYTISGSEKGEQAMTTVIMDEHYFDLYEIELIAGKTPQPFITNDTLGDIYLNQSAVRDLELTNPIGQNVRGKFKGTIAGIVKDFNVGSLHNPVEPVIMYNFLPTLRFISIKLNGYDQNQTISDLSRLWLTIYNGYPLEYSFLENDIQSLYNFEKAVFISLRIFSIIALIIACIGLGGLGLLLAKKRIKEFSIHKVLGGSRISILSNVYTKWILMILFSSTIAVASGYIVLNKWLSTFTYKIGLSIDIFLLPVLTMILILLVIPGIFILNSLAGSLTEQLRQE